MNLIQTLYIDNAKDPFRDSFGWVSPEYHLMGWALSCLQLKEIYGNITLFANSPAARLLIDTLQLPYSGINLSHDQLTLIHPDLWALPKIYTYSLQKCPFLHIDGDVFLFNRFNPELLEGELIAQNLEVATEYYTSTQRELIQYFSFFPPCVRKDFDSGIPIQAVNAGILGGNDVLFIHNFATLAFEYVFKNANRLKQINVNGFNVFFEQHLFYAFSKEKGIPVNVLFEGFVNDNGYKYLGDFHDVPFNKSYLHLLGSFKRNEFICIQMATKLRELYPNYYDRIVALFHEKNLWLSPCGFINGQNLSAKRINEQNNSHLQLLNYVANYYPLEIAKEVFQSDYTMFYKQLTSFLKNNSNSSEYLHERDLSAQHWYRDLFANTSAILNQCIVRSMEMEIIESSFNWAGLFNKHYQVGVEYYKDLQINKGQFYNMVVYEASDNGFSLYDINELDHAILLLLFKPLTISKLLIEMQIYFEDDVVQNYYEAYENLILTLVKQLVIKKAIQPFSN